VPTAVGAGLALALPALLPFGQVAVEDGAKQFDAVATGLWAEVQSAIFGVEHLSGRRVLAIVVIALVASAVLLPRRLAWVLPLPVLAVFAVNGALAWDRAMNAPESKVFATGAVRTWVDDRVPDGSSATALSAASEGCADTALLRHSFLLTEFFNSTVRQAAHVGGPLGDDLPSEGVRVRRDGQVVLASGEPLVADYVVAQPGVKLDGRRLATGTRAGLVLWRLGGPVRVVGARSEGELLRAACP